MRKGHLKSTHLVFQNPFSQFHSFTRGVAHNHLLFALKWVKCLPPVQLRERGRRVGPVSQLLQTTRSPRVPLISRSSFFTF